jgi:DNA-directed RNA polymerase specialized sigma24 family protein
MSLDIALHYKDIARITLGEYGGKVIDPEDLVQEVCLKIHRLNQGSSPYDPDKATVKHYIHIVARGVWIKKVTRDRGDVNEDYQTHREIYAPSLQADQFEDYLLRQLDFEDVLPRRVFLLLKMGYNQSEISELLSTSVYQVKKNKTLLKRLASDYIAAQ